MVKLKAPLRVDVLPFKHLLRPAYREAWRVGDFYIIASDVCGKERFFIAEAVQANAFDIAVEVISRPFKMFKDAHKIATSSARALRREMREIVIMHPSSIRKMLRSLVTHQTITTKTGVRATR